MLKVNLGSGTRVAEGWINYDFNPYHPDVIPHNLLEPLPHADGEVDAI